MEKAKAIIFGLILIIIGVILGLNSLEITNINIFFDGWWTLFIIIPCFIGLLNDKEKTGSLIGLCIGICLLLASLDVINFDLIWKLLLPIILVIIGLSVIFKDTFDKEIKRLTKNTDKSYTATFSEQVANFDDETFNGCELNAIFGGVKCHLEKANIKEDSLITACSIFGGIKIHVKDNVKVKVTSTSIFGGVDNKHKNPTDDKAKTIYVKATCIFGGVDIKWVPYKK